jgi:hypothetical protein
MDRLISDVTTSVWCICISVYRISQQESIQIKIIYTYDLNIVLHSQNTASFLFELRSRFLDEVLPPICMIHYKFPCLPLHFSSQRPSINLPWSLAAASGLESSRVDLYLVQGESRGKDKVGFGCWSIRFMHSIVVSFWIRAWKSWTEEPAVLSRGETDEETLKLQLQFLQVCIESASVCLKSSVQLESKGF